VLAEAGVAQAYPEASAEQTQEEVAGDVESTDQIDRDEVVSSNDDLAETTEESLDEIDGRHRRRAKHSRKSRRARKKSRKSKSRKPKSRNPHKKSTNTCNKLGDPNARVWFFCHGKPPALPTMNESAHEQLLGTKLAFEMDCTEEIDFACLCCTDFSRPLEYKRHGVNINLDAVQRPLGALGAMTFDDPTDPDAVIICTEDRAAELQTAQMTTGAFTIPATCISRVFTIAELAGSGPLSAGQVVFDERVAFLIQQGIPGNRVPTCVQTVPGTCPEGTPKSGSMPNSADQNLIASLQAPSPQTMNAGQSEGLASTVDEMPLISRRAPGATPVDLTEDKDERRGRARKLARGGYLATQGAFTLKTGGSRAGNG